MKQVYLLVLVALLTRFASQAGPYLAADKTSIGGAKPAMAGVFAPLDSPHRSMVGYTGNGLEKNYLHFAAEVPTDHMLQASGNSIENGLATAGSPPVVTLSGGATQTTNSPNNIISFAVDRLMQVSDSDSPTLASATFTITNFQSQEDVLYFLETSDDIGNIRSSYNASKGELVLTSAGATATIAQWQRALRNATYRNTATHPNATQRNVSIVVNDGANTSAVVNRTLIVNVSKPAINEFTATPSAVCTDNTVTFTAFTSTISIPYNYTLTNGVQSVTGTISTVNYPDFTREVKTAGTGTQRFTLKIIADGESVSTTTDVAVYSTPTVYSVTGGGTYCTGASSGLAVGLSGSQTGVNYQLLLNGTAVGSALAGTGSALNFGSQASAGTYTVQATNAIANCSQTTAMTGSATVTVNRSLVITSQTQPAASVCGPGNRGRFEVRFTGTGPVTATLFRDNTQLSQSTSTDGVVGFGFTPELQSGSYQIVVTSPCNSATTTFAPIVVNALPTPSFSGLASSYCQTTLPVTLSSVVSPIGGRFTIDGSPATELTPAKLSVGPHTVVYSYTNSSGCTGTVSQTVTIEQSSLEVQALADLYNATDGANWKNKTNWLTSCSPCGWYGVSCTNGRVTSIDLSNNNLIGTLPSSLSALTNLGGLQLKNNKLTGSIPASLSALINLSVLTLGDNQLSGSIPAGFSALTNLVVLVLENNQLSGSLPASFSTLTKLEIFGAYNNRLTGSIPASYAALTNLKFLAVNNNRLSGCIPQSLSVFCGGAQIELGNNPDLPLGGNWNAFCSNGTGSDDLRVTAAVSENPVCVGKTIALSFTSNRSYTGNGYRWQGPSGFTSTQAQPNLSLTDDNQSGVYSLTVNNGSSSCQTTASVSLTVNASPTVSIVGLASRYCQNAGAVTLVGSPTGGVFTIDGSRTTSLNSAILSVGSHTVVYSFTNASGCSSTTSQTVTIDPVPVVSITGLVSAYCQNAGTQSLNASPSGGVFTIDGQSVANLNPASLSGGQHTVMYAYTNTSGCTSAISQTLTINLPPTVSLTGLAAAYCQDAPVVMLAPLGNPSGGSFTLDGSPATVLNPAMLSVGDHSIRYTYTDNNSCSNTATQTVTIKQTPSAPTVVTQSGGPYPGGVSSLTISQNVGTVILAVSGCQGGTITWTGGSASTLAVSTTNLGTQTFTATCTSNGCTSPLATATVTVVAPTLKVLSRDPDNGQLSNNTIKPYLLLQNAGTTPIVYSTITLRYWLTTEDNIPLIFQKNYVQIGSNNLNLKYVPLNPTRQGATGYIEYSFSGGAGNLASNGDSGPLEIQLNKQDYSPFNQRDDYSYINNSAYTLNPRITAYQNGVIFYGQEPSGSGSPRKAVAEAGQVLNVTVLGNPVVGPSAEVEIRGVSGQTVHLKLVDLQGKTLYVHAIHEAGLVEPVSVPLSNGQGLLLLEVSTTTQRQQIKLLRTN